jgi:hypothetical protein
MANSNAFDLNAALKRWRAGLAQTGSLSSADLDELESHIRDSAERLQRAGLTGEEACLVAIRRTGRPDLLADEFAVVNRYAIWVDRLTWITLGWIIPSAVVAAGTLVSVRNTFNTVVVPPVILALALVLGLRSSLLTKRWRVPVAIACFLLICALVTMLVVADVSLSVELEPFSYILYNVTFFIQCLAAAMVTVLTALSGRNPSPGGKSQASFVQEN